MRVGVLVSVVLHAGAFAFAFLSLPESWRSKVVSEPVVPVELLTEAELSAKTSVPAMRREEPKPEPAPQQKKPEPKKPEPKPEIKPEPKKPELPAPDPKPEPKKPEPKKPPPKKPADDLDLDALSELVDKSRKDKSRSDAPEEVPTGERNQEQIGAGDRLTASDIDKMRAAVGRCWQTSALIGAPEPEKLVVELEIRLNRDGSLIGQPRTMNAMQINLSGNQFWKAAEQIAIRAVVSCQPYDFLAQDRYDSWKEMELNFDPSLMAGF